MKSSQVKLLLCGVMLAVSVSGQKVLADEQAGAGLAAPKESEPTATQRKSSTDRGLIFNTINVGVGAGASGAPVVPAAVKPPVAKAKSASSVANSKKQVRTPALATSASKTAASGTSKTAAKAAKSEPAAARPPAFVGSQSAVTVAHQVVTTASPVVKAWLNKAGDKPTYKCGEKLVVNVSASQDCSLVVFDFDGKSSLKQIFPNQYQPAGQVKAGETVCIGGPDSPFSYEVGGSGGLERIFVYAYPSSSPASPLTVAMLQVPRSPFRAAEMTLEQYRKLVNQSKVFFAREVTVVPKHGFQPVADTSATVPNKVELIFQVQ